MMVEIKNLKNSEILKEQISELADYLTQIKLNFNNADVFKIEEDTIYYTEKAQEIYNKVYDDLENFINLNLINNESMS